MDGGDTLELTTRRAFLGRGLTMIGIGATAPSFLVRSAYALADPVSTSQPASAPVRDRVLVVLQLAGGNDGLNTLIPFRADPYFKARPKLAIKPEDVLKIGDDVGLHPRAAGLKSLFDDGRLCAVQCVGYPNPNRSHFRSMDIWHTASPDGRRHDGWLGRYFDCECTGRDAPDPLKGIALTDEAPLAMCGERFAPVAFEDPDDLTLETVRRGGRAAEAIERMNRPLPGTTSAPAVSTLDFLRRTAMDARVSADRIRKAAGEAEFGRGLPREELGQSLRMVSRMIAAELPTRVYYVSFGGFDTHSNQLQRHARLMEQMGDALKAFVADLKDTGHLDRTLIMSFSEFGRRVAENGSGGTDHGEAAPIFLVGSKVKPGLVGEMPKLGELHRGDVPFQIDFRQVYASVLKGWLGADPQRVIGGPFKPLPILNA